MQSIKKMFKLISFFTIFLLLFGFFVVFLVYVVPIIGLKTVLIFLGVFLVLYIVDAIRHMIS
ncbi:hypothetical protein [Radiobacillus sp. PE A8.2]|uniref:hypothetical protein n=1 Tax=Radiobacillus sp. PE A8.2 TaxID=3380349 RepID=UPI00388FAA79